MTARPLRVLRLIARLNVGGPARHVAILDRGLAGDGFETLLVHGTTGPGEGSFEELVAGLPTRQLAWLRRDPAAGDDLRALAGLLRIMREFAPDVVHTHTAKAGMLGRLAAFAYNRTRRRSSRALVVHTFHGHVFDGYFAPAVSAAIRQTERWLARITDHVVVLSERQRLDIVQRWRICVPARVRVVPLGLELDPLLTMPEPPSSMRDALGIPGDAFVLGFVGRLVDIKDPDLLAAAFERCAAVLPHARLVVAGDGPHRPALEARFALAGLADRVRFLGWCRDLAALYGTVDAVVLTSRNEGTPVALIEAMAAGRPVVATAVGGVPDIVEHGRTGLLIADREPSAIAEAVAQLAREPVLRGELGRAGRLLASRFRASRLVEDVAQLYREGLAQRRRAKGSSTLVAE